MRSFAILMMLQGHFVSALLGQEFRIESNTTYQVWNYFRGITAPTFFTITGFIFMFLLLKHERSWNNPRLRKGVIRGTKLIAWGYALRLSFGLFYGYTHPSFIYTDVLHIIGVSIILLCLLYGVFTHLPKRFFSYSLLIITLVSFLFERYYHSIPLPSLPNVIAHYFTKSEGAVFSIFPWFGYVSIGAFLSTLFLHYKDNPQFHTKLILFLLSSGGILVFGSTSFLFLMHELTEIEVFYVSGGYNYLFKRLGDVFILFSIFVLLRKYLSHSLFISIGKVTLSIYIVHHIILYGSWFHTGLTRWFKYSLDFTEVFFGAILFMTIVCFLVLQFRTKLNGFFTKSPSFFLGKIKALKVYFVSS